MIARQSRKAAFLCFLLGFFFMLWGLHSNAGDSSKKLIDYAVHIDWEEDDESTTTVYIAPAKRESGEQKKLILRKVMGPGEYSIIPPREPLIFLGLHMMMTCKSCGETRQLIGGELDDLAKANEVCEIFHQQHRDCCK